MKHPQVDLYIKYLPNLALRLVWQVQILFINIFVEGFLQSVLFILSVRWLSCNIYRISSRMSFLSAFCYRRKCFCQNIFVEFLLLSTFFIAESVSFDTFMSHHCITSVRVWCVDRRNDSIIRRSSFDVKLSRENDEFRRRICRRIRRRICRHFDVVCRRLIVWHWTDFAAVQRIVHWWVDLKRKEAIFVAVIVVTVVVVVVVVVVKAIV